MFLLKSAAPPPSTLATYLRPVPDVYDVDGRHAARRQRHEPRPHLHEGALARCRGRQLVDDEGGRLVARVVGVVAGAARALLLRVAALVLALHVGDRELCGQTGRWRMSLWNVYFIQLYLNMLWIYCYLLF